MIVEETNLKIKIPLELKKKLQKHDLNVDSIISEVLEVIISRYLSLESYSEVFLPEKNNPNSIESADIPIDHFMRIPNLSLEQYERIVNENSWEYLDGILFHHSPESNLLNSILNLVNYRAMSILDPNLFIIRTSRVAISINQDKPEPDFMIFDRDDFRRKKRADGSESEIIESAPLLVIEIVSKSTFEIDELKEEKYLTKGIKEFWRIYLFNNPINVSVCSLKRGKYEKIEYTTGEIRSRVLPDFAINFDELMNPDSAR